MKLNRLGREKQRYESPRVKLRVSSKKRVPGIDKGKIWMAEDFDVLSERELAEWYGVAAARLEKRSPTLTSIQVRKALGIKS
jgi:hypothetical protein